MRPVFRRRLVRWIVVPGTVVFGTIQLVPYGWSHRNPPVTSEAPWPSERARDLARAACYDCHSNEVDWPVYSYIAPFSWLVRSDVDRGRDEVNFSEWDRDDGEADESARAVADGSMPPGRYELLHPSRRLSADEAKELIAALEAMDDSGGRGGGEGGDDRHSSNRGPG